MRIGGARRFGLTAAKDPCAADANSSISPPILPVAQDWSAEEVAATVADYFAMLEAELRGSKYNKAEHNRSLQMLLNDRSQQAIEFKHANISAVLIELGLPYINGYKPRSNYQELLKEEIELRLGVDRRVQEAAEAVVEAPADAVRPAVSLSELIVPAPTREHRDTVYERPESANSPRKGVNYLEREARNASLGRAGEEFVLEVERRRLWEAGSRSLADRVEHVSNTQGDGLGFDILSFDAKGRERLIEVKTTSFGAHTPFFVSHREVSVSAQRAADYALYRVFRFRAEPRLFIVEGALRDQFALEPIQYRASVT